MKKHVSLFSKTSPTLGNYCCGFHFSKVRIIEGGCGWGGRMRRDKRKCDVMPIFGRRMKNESRNLVFKENKINKTNNFMSCITRSFIKVGQW